MIKGIRLSRDEKTERARQVCEMYATNQFTIVDCLKANGIESESTWNKWQDEIAEIAEIYKKAQMLRIEAMKQDLTHRALNSMQKKLTGFFVEETESFYKVDDSGNRIPREIKVKKKFIPPSDALIQVALYNCDPDNWQNKHRTEQTGKDGKDLFKELTIKVVDGRQEPKQLAEPNYIDVEPEDSVN